MAIFNRATTTGVILAVAFAMALTIAPEEPQWIPYKEEMATSASTDSSTVRFLGGDGKTMLTGHWYMPSDKEAVPPVVLMAHGLGLVQSQGLDAYIKAFRTAGMAVLTMDYATFGESDGLPRHQVCPHCHIADLQAAIRMIQDNNDSLIQVDASRIGLWGTSLGGGHVLEVAAAVSTATDGMSSIKAVVSQVPHLASGFESVVIGSFFTTPPLTYLHGLGSFVLGLLKWAAWKVVLGRPAYFPMVGVPGSASMMQNPGDVQGYLGYLAPSEGSNDVGWTNAATTESGLRIVFQYRPLSVVSKISEVIPVFLVTAEKDTLCPAKYVHQAHANLPHSEFLQVDEVGHFDLYRGSPLEQTLAAEVAFLRKNLF